MVLLDGFDGQLPILPGREAQDRCPGTADGGDVGDLVAISSSVGITTKVDTKNVDHAFIGINGVKQSESTDAVAPHIRCVIPQLSDVGSEERLFLQLRVHIFIRFSPDDPGVIFWQFAELLEKFLRFKYAKIRQAVLVLPSRLKDLNSDWRSTTCSLGFLP